MEPLRPTFSCRFQDLPTLGGFVLQAARRDQAFLATKSVKYKTDTYLDAYAASLQAVGDLVHPAAFTAAHKKLTEQMEADAKSIRPLLNDLDIRLDDADDLPPTGPQLTVKPADFGIKPLRLAITDNDVEGITFHGKALVDLLTDNAAPLALVEFPRDDQQALVDLIESLTRSNLKQNELISERDTHVQANMKVLNDFYDKYMRRVMTDGKKAHKETDPAKTNDYTLQQLKKQVAAPKPRKKKGDAPAA